MADCCAPKQENSHDGCTPKSNRDYMFWSTFSIVVISYFGYLLSLLEVINVPAKAYHFGHSVFELMNTMWWGIALGAIFVGLLGIVPKEVIISALGRHKGIKGIFRATLLGLFFDLCNHGILLVGMKLYERGASLGQTMAFLIASPWNSFSLTLILIALVGWSWTLVFIVLSAVIAIVTGLIFEKLVEFKTLPNNSNTVDLPEGFTYSNALTQIKKDNPPNLKLAKNIIVNGFFESRSIIRWLLLGIVMAATIQTFVSTENMQEYFGASLLGLMLTLAATTVIEVCSEGSTPIAADLLNRASAPGNAFTFLMAGVATDYTEIAAIKETTKSWKCAFYLPLVTVPQVLAISYVLNFY